MQTDIHPNYEMITVNCACGSTFQTRASLGRDTLALEVCASCHPFYTGQQKKTSAGRARLFEKRYGAGSSENKD